MTTEPMPAAPMMVPSADTDEVPGMKMRGAALMVRVHGPIVVGHVLLDQKGPEKAHEV